MKSSLIAAAAAAFVSTGEPAAAAQTCMAAVYTDGFGRPLADGKRHSVDELLVAHRTLPLGTVVDITLLATGKTVRAIVRDRGPFVRNRCVDLSAGTARALGVADVGRVKIEPVVASSTAQASPK